MDFTVWYHPNEREFDGTGCVGTVCVETLCVETLYVGTLNVGR
jgi:hypothetical protein